MQFLIQSCNKYNKDLWKLIVPISSSSFVCSNWPDPLFPNFKFSFLSVKNVESEKIEFILLTKL